MKRKIEWEHWNSKIEELENQKKKSKSEESEENKDIEEERSFQGIIGLDGISNDMVYTPWGQFNKDNPLKPTDRYDCWIGHTNFQIGKAELYILNRVVPGIAALTVLDKYTFCIGIARSFNFGDVRTQIETKIYNRIEREADA